ncbi:hypothetical protein EJ05DRAFT_475929 [Pseudovirgaria hyperparasitica]|uniref:Uncharacterized protein n=1 Tax=Pseudovirgaria hyperparasitica TaxID=470096 RepID=A0A6A6WBY5_9PEZI|nr:uncharacterized protein EJ05DRAFT_475929 [Pseudovirgaria hyperparasitica]KAF2758621.1 hypothetical protein EJ05DRAFT_475929 [Pseudovirgaria hyperparasitica]
MQPLEAIRGLECPWFFRYQGNDRHTRYRLCMDYMRSQMRRHPSSGYVPNPEFIRHVSQLEDALRDWKEHLARQTAERNRKMEAERDAWVDATIEEWGSDDGHATQEEDGEEDGN